MSLSCTARALKLTLTLFNLIFLICGLVCVGIGSWLILDKYAIDALSAATAQVAGYEENAGLRDLATKPTAVRQIGHLLLGGGLVVIIVAFLGCCGAAKEWRPLLCCYATCLMVILAIEIAAGIYAAMHSNMSSLKMYNGTDVGRKDDGGQLVKAAWDKIMQEKSCCGVDSKMGEFNASGWFAMTRGKHPFPPACCPPDDHGRLLRFCPVISRFGDGCYEKVAESFHEVRSHFSLVSWALVMVAFLQGCIVHMFYRNRLHFSAIFGILFVLVFIQSAAIILGVQLFRRIKIELLYYY